MDIYEEKEHVISSDEYSEEDDDDDDDALMNDAVRAQQSSIVKTPLETDSLFREKHKWRIEQKQKQLSSLIRRNKISIIYKNKSIKWLNSKKQREKYKGHIIRNGQDISNRSTKSAVLRDEEWKLNSDVKESGVHTNNVVSLDDDEEEEDNEINREGNNSSDMSEEEVIKPKSSRRNLEKDQEVLKGSKDMSSNTTTQTEELQTRKGTCQSSQTEFPEKRARSCSPVVGKSVKEGENSEKRFKSDGPQFYKKINEMFPTFDGIAKNHIEYITNNNLNATENKMKSIFNEIKTLNEILHAKEMEWNRILHLKMVKEEIYSRLRRKKHIFEMNETLTKTRSQNTLLELKELELYLYEKNSPSIPNNSSIQQLIENRANMKAEDLEREKSNTSRLHSLLVSRNMLPDIESTENKVCGNGDVNAKCNDEAFKANAESYQQLENRTLLNRGRQGEFKDVKSIIADFRQNNLSILHRDNKAIQHSRYLPFTKDQKPDFYPTGESIEDALTTPGGSSRKRPFGQEFEFSHTLHNHYNACLDDGRSTGNGKRIDITSPKNIQYPYCQECKIHESRFVCAGCGNQWYCSKKCQVSAWDKHSEICTD